MSLTSLTRQTCYFNFIVTLQKWNFLKSSKMVIYIQQIPLDTLSTPPAPPTPPASPTPSPPPSPHNPPTSLLLLLLLPLADRAKPEHRHVLGQETAWVGLLHPAHLGQ